ncbi:hypothetical protein GCM10007094_01660 [Pseudovibrio japonicus]|uniref:Type I restriction enzyme R protein N-terminal domain-containing protein n=1 Tax=Pseudovibrio japonicus TaxID=366534 RepID=A0ABQ3DYE2_9HYPH|nr:type I restriction enzyme HsdR N-terminal domain-containing protein [Pseudovibrio japonicus]GHB17725.1 hypothetical protein GCM10007094_01660 [Pseudovibrio japonicus]
MTVSKMMNETTVRYEVIDPIIRELGYKRGSQAYLELERKLNYPYKCIGHRKEKKDLPIGYPDYFCGLEGRRGSFVVEAKSTDQKISQSHREQAHSYATHPEIAADYFVLCDGHSFQIYETLAGISSPPVVNVPVGKLERRKHEIFNILRPENLQMLCRKEHDTGLQLSEGLRSNVTITNGQYTLSEIRLYAYANGVDVMPKLEGTPAGDEFKNMLNLQSALISRIEQGRCYRNDEGRITADISFSGSTKNNDAAMKQFGISELKFITNDEFISSNSSFPTLFETNFEFGVTKGELILPFLGDAFPSPQNLSAHNFIRAALHLSGNKIVGTADSFTNLHMPSLNPTSGDIELKLVGKYALSCDLR